MGVESHADDGGRVHGSSVVSKTCGAPCAAHGRERPRQAPPKQVAPRQEGGRERASRVQCNQLCDWHSHSAFGRRERCHVTCMKDATSPACKMPSHLRARCQVTCVQDATSPACKMLSHLHERCHVTCVQDAKSPVCKPGHSRLLIGYSTSKYTLQAISITLLIEHTLSVFDFDKLCR